MKDKWSVIFESIDEFLTKRNPSPSDKDWVGVI